MDTFAGPCEYIVAMIIWQCYPCFLLIGSFSAMPLVCSFPKVKVTYPMTTYLIADSVSGK